LLVNKELTLIVWNAQINKHRNMVTTVVRDCTRKRKLVSALFFRFYTQIIWKYVQQINLIISLQCGSCRDFRCYCYYYYYYYYYHHHHDRHHHHPRFLVFFRSYFIISPWTVE
jgi:hypothetical protein